MFPAAASDVPALQLRLLVLFFLAAPSDAHEKLLSNEDILPVVTHRYPSVDHEDVPLTEGVAWVRPVVPRRTVSASLNCSPLLLCLACLLLAFHSFVYLKA